MRRFMQTFILAPYQSPKKFFVRSDILRYLHKVLTILLHSFTITIIKSSKHHYIVLWTFLEHRGAQKQQKSGSLIKLIKLPQLPQLQLLFKVGLRISQD